jgi:Domain of unknown function (DUF4105)
VPGSRSIERLHPGAADIERHNLMRVIRWIGGLLVVLTAIIAVAWAFGAVWFDAPFGNANKIAATLLAIAFAIVLLFVRPFWRKLGICVVLFAGVLIWWLTLSPTNDSDWQPDVAQKAWADIQGDEVTLHNVRNCDYRTQTDYTPHWETRTVRLSQITGIDLAINFWGSPWIAHPIVSFQFADAPPLCFSIETRKKLGQTYSTIGGLYRQYELIYIVADERDVIRLRTNYRNEDVSPSSERKPGTNGLTLVKNDSMKLKFYGTRGSIPICDAGFQPFGGNPGSASVRCVRAIADIHCDV